MNIKPIAMLAASEIPTESELLTFLSRGPILMTPKYDGIRALIGPTCVLSRSQKPIPNHDIQQQLVHRLQRWPMDGEIVCYTREGKMCDFNTTQSFVMRHGGHPIFKYHIFDCWGCMDDYQGRLGYLHRMLTKDQLGMLVTPEWAFTLKDVHLIRDKHLAQGYEGSIGRHPNSPYKQGRATLSSGWMFKLKPFTDEEAHVIGWEPLQRNHNPATRNERGLQERSSRMEGKVVEPGMLGSLIVYNDKWGQFNVGSGFTDLQRCNPEQFMDKVITFKYQPNHSKDKPHAPTFKSIRESE